MTEQVPSDLLSRLKEQIVIRRDNPHGKFIAVTVSELTTLVECAEALQSVKLIAEEAREHWDKDRDMKVGKILIALSGAVKYYRPDIDKIHEALAKVQTL